MKIVYPSLVEDAYSIAEQAGTIAPEKVNDVKAQIYRLMVHEGMLTENGNPTQKAVDQGLVIGLSKDSQSEPDTLSGFKRMYPIYEGYSDDHFRKTSMGWVIDTYVMWGVANQVLDSPDSTEEQRQTAYSMLEQLEKHPK